ncbi:zf-MYND domain-containing protein [Rhizoctonia solani AG-1 IA]|uniref:Zf-MYND domain-containing protein n=1 Tax=Thanatephorus cucumeris (strain AG1-IA) TaxID=983506 RepID=L8WZS2_THACA|nr:zf-MYND domain-containing protein [Rhizoctonia solani AG-1 IA]
MNVDINSRGYRPVWEANTQQVDLEDCREIVSAYIDRFNPLYPILHSPIAFLDGPILLRPLLQFITPGTSDLLPKVLEVTVKRIWEEVEDPSPDYKPDMLVDAVRDTFANYIVFIKCGLIDLAARAILLLELPSEPPVLTNYCLLAGSVDYLPRTKAFFGQVCILLPPSCMYIVWDLLFPDWFKYRSYLVWYSEIRELVPKDREHIRTRLATWNEIGMALGYQVHEKSPFWCGYARCHDPLGMGGVQFTCPMCRNGTYCSARCQSDWRGPQAAHSSLCASARILLKTQSST